MTFFASSMVNILWPSGFIESSKNARTFHICFTELCKSIRTITMERLKSIEVGDTILRKNVHELPIMTKEVYIQWSTLPFSSEKGCMNSKPKCISEA